MAKSDQKMDGATEQSGAPSSDATKAAAPAAPAATPAQDPPKDAGKLDTYYVKGPGGVFFRGKPYSVGDVLNDVSDEDALSLGDNIAQGTGAPKGLAIPEKGGKFRVTSFGSIYRGGKLYGEGDEIDCTAAEAAEWSDRLTSSV